MPTKKVAVTATVAPKKAAVKSVAKKVSTTAPKKTAAKKAVGKPLVYADNNTSFWVADGQILNSLLALKDALAVMDKSVFNQHVSANKNDFASWVSAVLCDAACAKELKAAKTPAAAKVVVARHLKLYAI